MTWRPQLNVVCGRCGKPRGLTHVCVSGTTRKATATPKFTFGICLRCKKPQGNPLTHTCQPKSDFKRRKARYAKQQQARTRKTRQKEAHDYQACADKDCPRPLCAAFKTGYSTGSADGYEQGWRQGHDRGFAEGIAACPLPHQ
jgi:flagellar biosynthesis/type III secretory pathway protein FliH